MYLLNGKKLAPKHPFTIGLGDDAIQYPANWLDLSSEADRVAIGIVDAPDPVWPDERFYGVVENDDGSLTVTLYPREQLELVMWSAIKAQRDLRTESGGYKVGTKWFHSDQKSRSQQLGLVLLGANIPASLQWKTMDGTFVIMTPQLAGQILGAAAASDQAIFAVAESHLAALEASADPAIYDFSSGWPSMYGEV